MYFFFDDAQTGRRQGPRPNEGFAIRDCRLALSAKSTSFGGQLKATTFVALHFKALYHTHSLGGSASQQYLRVGCGLIFLNDLVTLSHQFVCFCLM
jgi:hypothetical protein